MLSNPVLLLQLAADAENEDNISEQKRQNGKRVRYGEVIQVKQSAEYLDVVTIKCTKLQFTHALTDDTQTVIHLRQLTS